MHHPKNISIFGYPFCLDPLQKGEKIKPACAEAFGRQGVNVCTPGTTESRHKFKGPIY